MHKNERRNVFDLENVLNQTVRPMEKSRPDLIKF